MSCQLVGLFDDCIICHCILSKSDIFILEFLSRSCITTYPCVICLLLVIIFFHAVTSRIASNSSFCKCNTPIKLSFFLINYSLCKICARKTLTEKLLANGYKFGLLGLKIKLPIKFCIENVYLHVQIYIYLLTFKFFP